MKTQSSTKNVLKKAFIIYWLWRTPPTANRPRLITKVLFKLKYIVEGDSILPGMDFPSSRYSLTEGLKKPVGITGDVFSGCSLSSLWSGSGTTTGAPGERAFLARFERMFCCSSDPSVMELMFIWVESFFRWWKNCQLKFKWKHKFLFGQQNWAALKNKCPARVREMFYRINERENCIWSICGDEMQAKLTEKRVHYHKFLEPENCQRFLPNELWHLTNWQMVFEEAAEKHSWKWLKSPINLSPRLHKSNGITLDINVGFHYGFQFFILSAE